MNKNHHKVYCKLRETPNEGKRRVLRNGAQLFCISLMQKLRMDKQKYEIMNDEREFSVSKSFYIRKKLEMKFWGK